MKLKLSVFLFLSLFFTSFSFSQTKYFQESDGNIIDTVMYQKMKNDKIAAMKAIFTSKEVSVIINEKLKEIKRTSDSLIFEYAWDIKIDSNSKTKQNSFEPEVYIGKKFPEQNLYAIDGKIINIQNLKGKPTMINFWFTSCKPCIEEMPVLNIIKQKLKDKAHFVAITYEPVPKAKKFLKKHKFDFVQIADAKELIDSMYMTAFPVNMFLDKDGTIRKIENGIPYVFDEKFELKMGDGNEFLTYLQDLINEGNNP